jgi:hypothetical protein
MSDIEVNCQPSQEDRKPESSCYDLDEHPEGIESLGDSLLSLDIEQIGESLTKVLKDLNKKTESVVKEELRDCSKKIADTIETANFFEEQLIYHKTKFEGYLFILDQQMSTNITKGLRVAQKFGEKGFSSLTPIAKLLVVDLNQIRNIVLTKDLV